MAGLFSEMHPKTDYAEKETEKGVLAKTQGFNPTNMGSSICATSHEHRPQKAAVSTKDGRAIFTEGHRTPYRQDIIGPTAVPMWDRCPLGLLDKLTVTHIIATPTL